MTLENRIIKLANYNAGKIFGGYVRDYLANEKPSDMDIHFCQKTDMKEFILQLTEIFSIQVEKILKNSKCEFDNGRYLIRSSELPFEYIDCTYGSFNHYTGGTTTAPDCDVNLLTLTFNGIIGTVISPDFYNFNMAEAVKNASKKRFKAMPGADPKRIQKMLDKGWAKV